MGTPARVTSRCYDDAGQRIAKQVGTGNAELYLREGATTLGVFTVNSSGTPVSWYFNLAWEGRVVGRQPSSGNRDYYHFDILGSTRAVTQGALIVESHDYDPLGLEMPARGLSRGTKEAFSGKEQDVETGLDYFGARYYMPALGRWAAVDPMHDDMPEWSTYNYVYDNPSGRTDPDGRQPGLAGVGGPAHAFIVDQVTKTFLVNWYNNEAVPLMQEFYDDFLTLTVVGDALVSLAQTPAKSPAVIRTLDNAVERMVGSIADDVAREAEVLPRIGGDAAQAERSLPSTLKPGPHAGESIPVGPEPATAAQQADINRIGRETGCHTCGAKDPGTKSGNHVLDHQPATKLNPPGNPQRGYPHCIKCMRRQGGEVNAERARRQRASPPPPPPRREPT